MAKDLEAVAGSIGALEDELRRRMYLFIRQQDHPVTREEAARRVGISRKLAAFHLDKLVEKGLLSVHFGRARGRRPGRGAGRSSKLYEPSKSELMVSLPERHYEFMGRILTEALQTRTEGEAPEDAARRIARNNGLAIGRELAKKANISISGSKRVAAVVRKILSQRGYEPYSDGHGGLRLRNCPFHELSRGAPELICELNHQFVGGLLRGLADRRLKAILDRQPPQCCVHVKSPGR